MVHVFVPCAHCPFLILEMEQMPIRNHRLNWKMSPVVVIFVFNAMRQRVSVVTSDRESEPRCCPFRFLCDDRVSVVRPGESLSCGVLCAEDPPPRADLSYSSSVSSGESISECAGELWGFVWSSFVVVAVVLSDIERRRFPVFCVLFECF